jgi:DNA-binding NarL/FixJ family response regulator
METGMEKNIRVLVANRPRFMRELILSTLSDQPDIEIVAEIEDEAEILASVEKTAPHFVLISQDALGARPHVCDLVLQKHPEVRLIAVAPHRNHAVCYRASLDIQSCEVEASEESILDLLRNRPTPTGNWT